MHAVPGLVLSRHAVQALLACLPCRLQSLSGAFVLHPLRLSNAVTGPQVNGAKIRHIGVTNFDVPRLDEMLSAGVPIVSNQAEPLLVDGYLDACSRGWQLLIPCVGARSMLGKACCADAGSIQFAGQTTGKRDGAVLFGPRHQIAPLRRRRRGTSVGQVPRHAACPVSCPHWTSFCHEHSLHDGIAIMHV